MAKGTGTEAGPKDRVGLDLLYSLLTITSSDSPTTAHLP